MKMSKFKLILIPFLLLVFMIGIVDDADAQRRKRKKRESSRDRVERDEDYKPFSERITYEIGIGNANSFNSFSIALRPAAAYKVNSFLNVGLGAKYSFDFINIPNRDDITLNSYGVFPYAQIKFTESIYAKGIYEWGKYEFAYTNFTTDSRTELFPLFGGGYSSGFGDWKWGFEVLFVGNEEIRDITNVVQYWIVASYRL